ncbi:hypothetical protein NC652_018847 [Populus alba x Populus x berolinensis]|nr:hypothetical protein NC652_018847 [Populus alba x Populus x berolinensis]
MTANDEGMETIAKEFGVEKVGLALFTWIKRQKKNRKDRMKLSKGDPANSSQIEREREREAARITGTRVLHQDPYRSRSTSRSIFTIQHSRSLYCVEGILMKFYLYSKVQGLLR